MVVLTLLNIVDAVVVITEKGLTLIISVPSKGEETERQRNREAKGRETDRQAEENMKKTQV